jgi:DNA recombination protein RmuC
VQETLDDVGRLDERVGRLNRHFDQTVEDIRQIRITTDKVTKRAERIDEIQLGPDSPAGDLPPPAPRPWSTRRPSAEWQIRRVRRARAW